MQLEAQYTTELTLVTEAAQTLEELADPSHGLFDSRTDVLKQAVLLIAWASIEVRRGATLGRVNAGGKTLTVVTMPFMTRIRGGEQPATDTDATVKGADEYKRVPVTIPANYFEAAQQLLAWSTRPFNDLAHLVAAGVFLLSYAVKARREGAYLASMDEPSNVLKKLFLPFDERVHGAG
jgi:hypothetical protein